MYAVRELVLEHKYAKVILAAKGSHSPPASSAAEIPRQEDKAVECRSSGIVLTQTPLDVPAFLYACAIPKNADRPLPFTVLILR